jgi:hypothetical protein
LRHGQERHEHHHDDEHFHQYHEGLPYEDCLHYDPHDLHLLLFARRLVHDGLRYLLLLQRHGVAV